MPLLDPLAVVAGCTTAVFVLTAASLTYWYGLIAAAMRAPRPSVSAEATHRFAVLVPAHDEEASIGETVAQLQRQVYPQHLFSVFVCADNCSDRTAEAARRAGATCLERNEPAPRGKGAALTWLLPRVLAAPAAYDAVVVFDADTHVDPGFLRVMDAMLRDGHQVIQGNHVIANPERGWFPAIMYTAFILDNLRNLGRSTLGLSSKLMGDAMCFARAVLERHPWRTRSQTEDVEYWATLLLNDTRVVFAPHAIARGEMVANLRLARHQRARWMRGRANVTRRFAVRLLQAGLSRLNWRQIDAAVELAMPSYSTLFVLSAVATGAWALLPPLAAAPSGYGLAALWSALILYPVVGLVRERAPGHVYRSLAYAPAYVAWRSLLRLWVGARRRPTPWVRTPHGRPRGTNLE